MKVLKKLFFVFLMLFLFNNEIDALCYDAELNEWASDLELKFTDFDGELIDENTNEPIGYKIKYAFYFSLSKYREDVTLKASDDYNHKFEWQYIPGHKEWGIGDIVGSEPCTYKIDVVANEKSSCSGEIIKSFNYVVEPFNLYIKTEKCEQYPDAPMCAKYKDTSNVTEEEFNVEMENYIETVTPPKTSIFVKIGNFIVDYLIYIIIPFVAIAIFYTLRINDVKRKEANK